MFRVYCILLVLANIVTWSVYFVFPSDILFNVGVVVFCGLVFALAAILAIALTMILTIYKPILDLTCLFFKEKDK